MNFYKIGFLMLFVTIFSNLQTSVIEINQLDFKSLKIANDFDIVHISDLHGKTFGKNQINLLDKINSQYADVVVITGDLLDSNDDNELENVKQLIQGINTKIFYVNGNHDVESSNYKKLELFLIENGVNILNNESYALNDEITIHGINDPVTYYQKVIDISNYSKDVDNLVKDSSQFNLLLAHQPQFYLNGDYDKFDLTLSGHTHGGQIRLPYLGAIIVPGQKLFPKLDEGLFSNDKTSIFISSGLGTTILDLRLFNQPEITKICLKKMR